LDEPQTLLAFYPLAQAAGLGTGQSDIAVGAEPRNGLLVGVDVLVTLDGLVGSIDGGLEGDFGVLALVALVAAGAAVKLELAPRTLVGVDDPGAILVSPVDTEVEGGILASIRRRWRRSWRNRGCPGRWTFVDRVCGGFVFELVAIIAGARANIGELVAHKPTSSFLVEGSREDLNILEGCHV